MKKLGIIVLVILAFIGVLIGSGISIYNGLVSRNIAVSASWAQVENQLQRRNDLIPNIVSTVKGYAAYEKDVLENITKARSAWANASNVSDKVQAATQMDSALGRLLVVSENYPTLKADQSFLKLMDELAGTENRIAVERMRYNEAVQSFNTAIRVFPGNVIAGMFGLKSEQAYFKAVQKATEVPEVKF